MIIRGPLVAAFLLLLLAGPLAAQKPTALLMSGWVDVQVKEPSDLTAIPGAVPQRFFVVSDNGFVAEIGADGRVKRSSREVAFDLEGALLMGAELLVVDERTRRILWLDTATFAVTRRMTFPYAGARNSGYEAIVYNPVRQRMQLITERNPVRILELDQEFRMVNEIDIDLGVRDISSATWHDGHLWLLSDMDMQVLKCDPSDHRVLQRWSVPVLNPEGMAFGADGLLYILSDDRQRLYTFRTPDGTP